MPQSHDPLRAEIPDDAAVAPTPDDQTPAACCPLHSARLLRVVGITAIMGIMAFAVIVGSVMLYSMKAAAQAPGAQSPRGLSAFDLSKVTIPKNEIRAGGPPKDGIPAITDPKLLSPQEARYLRNSDRVVGVSIANESRAYPITILNYHEIVNDRVGETPIAVTYCPLCDSAVVFDRRTAGGKTREFGVSGLLYNSNVLMYDRGAQTESLWSQLAAEGVSGPGATETLKTLPLELTTWQDWRTRHPQTTVISDKTGHTRNYNTNPYTRYFASNQLMFPARPLSDRLPAKTRVLGVWSGNAARAYPVTAFDENGETRKEEINGKPFTLVYDGESKSLRVASADEEIGWMYTFWFAWHAFRPHTELAEK